MDGEKTSSASFEVPLRALEASRVSGVEHDITLLREAPVRARLDERATPIAQLGLDRDEAAEELVAGTNPPEAPGAML
jgi:hypothetical protein